MWLKLLVPFDDVPNHLVRPLNFVHVVTSTTSRRVSIFKTICMQVPYFSFKNIENIRKNVTKTPYFGQCCLTVVFVKLFH